MGGGKVELTGSVIRVMDVAGESNNQGCKEGVVVGEYAFGWAVTG